MPRADRLRTLSAVVLAIWIASAAVTACHWHGSEGCGCGSQHPASAVACCAEEACSEGASSDCCRCETPVAPAPSGQDREPAGDDAPCFVCIAIEYAPLGQVSRVETVEVEREVVVWITPWISLIPAEVFHDCPAARAPPSVS